MSATRPCTVEEKTSSLLASRSDDSDTTSGDIPESDMKSSEVGTDNKEHPEGLLGVLDLWQEGWVESEGQCDLCGGVSIGLVAVREEDVLVGW